jgi:excisionase family DNA binding protein
VTTLPKRPSARTSDGDPASEPLLTVEQAAAMLAVPASWLKQRVASHMVACTRLGRHIRFTRDQVASIVAASEQPALTMPLTGLTRRSRRPA